MQRTEQPRDTHLETKPNEVEWAPRRDEDKKQGGDNIPGSPGYNAVGEAPVEKPERAASEVEGVNVSSHALDEVPAPEKGTREEGYTPVEAPKH